MIKQINKQINKRISSHINQQIYKKIIKKRRQKKKKYMNKNSKIFIFQLTFEIFNEVDFIGETVSEIGKDDFEETLSLFEVS